MSVTSIQTGTIKELYSDKNTTFITVAYEECSCRRKNEKLIKLVTGPLTTILSTEGKAVAAGELQEGMTINATFSAAMTRSLPPQANVYLIRIVAVPPTDCVTEGIIREVDRRFRSFLVVCEKNGQEAIRFHMAPETRVLGRDKRLMDFVNLVPGMRVCVRHAAFMTASLPPQSTAYEVRVCM